MIALWFLIAWAVGTAVVALRAAARARAARAELLALVRVLEHRAATTANINEVERFTRLASPLRALQSDLRATFPEFFTDPERAR